MEELDWLPAWQLRDLFVAHKVSPVEYAHHLLERIATHNPSLGAFLTIDPGQVLSQARQAEAALFSGDAHGPLHGVPVSLKDSIVSAGLRTTWGSLLFEDYVPLADSVLAERVRDTGAIILGKTNVPEFQIVGRSNNRLGGEALNPWNVGRIAGGSSGGSATSVAAGFNAISIGGDDGGSIRLPAAYCGIFGMMASFGRVPRLTAAPGEFPGHIFQHCGPMTRDVRDGAIMLAALAGPYAGDPYALPAPAPGWLDGLDEGVDGYRCGLVAFSGANVAPPIQKLVEEAASDLGRAGASIVQTGITIEVPWTAIGMLTALQIGDFLKWIVEDDERRGRVAPYTIEFARFAEEEVTAEREAKAWTERREAVAALHALFDTYDILLSPTTGQVAPDAVADWASPHPVQEYAASTVLINASGLPAASVPCGMVDGLPVGIQVIGRRGAEIDVLRVARALERERPWPSPNLA